MSVTIDGTLGVTSPAETTTNLAYTGTLTGGTGIVNLGSGQVYKDASGNVGIGSGSFLLNSPAGLGYGIGSGGTVPQATSKSTAVTLNKPSGQITMNAAALAGNTYVEFAFNNSVLGLYDVLIVNLSDEGGWGVSSNYNAWVKRVSTGQGYITLKNISAGSLSEAVVIKFAIIKGASA